jgi:signal transduction histidine kinase
MKGDYKKALEYQLSASEMQDSLMNKEIVEHVKTMELKYRTAEKDKELLKNKLNIEIQAKLLRKKNSLIIIVVSMAAAIMLVCLALYSRFRQKQKLLLRDEQIKEMKALIKGEEQERIRLAQELHDGIGGMLAAVNMNMAAARKRDFNNKAELNSIMQMIADTSEEVRKTSHNLMPSALLRKNLREALLYYFDYINKDGSLQIDLHTDNLSGNWGDSDITLVFRIVQELVQNIIKHAAATHAVVCIEQEGANLSIIVEDNGSGYDISRTPRGFGLEHLDFRVRAMKGNIHINSAPGTGTSVTIKLALKIPSY